MVRPLANLIATVLVLLAFESLGWLKIAGNGVAGRTDTAIFIDHVIVAALMFAVGEVLEVAFSGLVLATSAWALMLLPFYYVLSGYARLEAASHLLKDWFHYDNQTFLKMLTMSLVFGSSRWHLSRREKKKKPHEQRREGLQEYEELPPEDTTVIRR